MTTDNTLTAHRRIIVEFIKLYRSEPCLWMTKCAEYRDRACKDNAYERLVAKLRELDSTADRDKVVKKINSLRTNWRKEKKKVEVTSGLTHPYKPRLWYYRLFEFLEDYCSGDSTKYDDYEAVSETEGDEIIDSLDYDELQTDETSEHGFHEEYALKPAKPRTEAVEIKPFPISIPSPSPSFSKKAQPKAAPDNTAKRCRSSDDEEQHSLYDSYAAKEKHIKLQEDRHEAFGRNVAMKLRHMTDKTQRLLAEKLINDALFMAELGELSMAHGVTSFNTRSSHSPFETEYISGSMEHYESMPQQVEEVEVINKETPSNRRLQELQEISRSILRRV